MTDLIPMTPATPEHRVLALCGDTRLREQLESLAQEMIWQADFSADVETAARLLAEEPIDVCLVEVREGCTWLEDLHARAGEWQHPAVLLAVVPSRRLGEAGLAIPADCEVIPAPVGEDRLRHRLHTAVSYAELRGENQRLRRRLRHRLKQDLVGHSRAVDTLRQVIDATAECDSPVLVTGEPGSGVLTAARAIHLAGDRAHRAVLSVDCGLQSSSFLAGQLFGERPSGFRGSAVPRQPGRWEQAAGGTLILDNVDAVALPLQKVLLDYWQRHSASSARPRQQTVRLIGTSHVELSRLVEQGMFRADLYALLSSCTVVVPPLRKRRDDIAPLTEHFLGRLAREQGQPPRRIEPAALRLFESHNWPENVRELSTVINRACTVDDSGWLTAEMVRPWLAAESGGERSTVPGLALKDMERKLIETTFNRCGGNRERTAQALGIGLRTLSGKLREYGYPPRGGPGSNRKVAQRRAA